MKPPSVSVLDFGGEDGPDFFTWDPPEIPDSVDPTWLGKLLRGYREYVRGQRVEIGRPVDTLGAISDAGLERLVLLAYRATFLTDEGRPVRGRVVVRGEDRTQQRRPAAGVDDNFRSLLARVGDDLFSRVEEARLHLLRFADRIPLDSPTVFGKLAPVLLRAEGAVTVTEEAGELFVSGLAALDVEDGHWELFGLPRLPQPSAGLVVELLGPGHLQVREGSAEFTLHADRLVYHRRCLDLPLVREWLHENSSRLTAELKSRPGISDTSHLLWDLQIRDQHGWPHTDLIVMFTRIVRAALATGHGGALVVLPNADPPPIRMKFRIEPIDLGAELIDLWQADCEVRATGRADAGTFQNAVESKRYAVQQWLRLLRSVGQLTAADGCVVLGRNLIVRGYGGVIEAPEPREGESTRCVDLTGGVERETAADDFLRLYGTRHKSAYALCRSVPGSIAFILSQDGDLRVFASESGTVYFAANLQP